MLGFDHWKKGFDSWEASTADRLEKVLKSPIVLRPAGKLLSVAMKVKAAQDKAMSTLWGTWGLPTKRDQERTLHALNQLESRLLDLEEQLASNNKK